MFPLTRLGIGAFIIIVVISTSLRTTASELRSIQANSNQMPAGSLSNGVLNINLEIQQADWFPQADTGPSMKVFAFGERGTSPQIPGPMIRVPEGTKIHATVRNLLSVAAKLHGMHSRPGRADDTLTIEPGETREVSFDAGVPGTYFYWADTGAEVWNGFPVKDDSQLSGAFIIDPAAGSPPDRVFVIGIWRDQPSPDQSFDVPVINGKSWPYTERLTYTPGEVVRWRWLNPTNLTHPMHMHGSYYRVDSRGNGETDTIYPEAQRRMVVTEALTFGNTMTTYWVPERSGRWLFHCHTLAHITPDIMFLRKTDDGHETHSSHQHEMTGLVMGIDVLPKAGEVAQKTPIKPKHKLDLVVGKITTAGVTTKGYKLVGKRIPSAPFSCPGPPIVLTQGEPVAIRIRNQLDEPTAVHWHGIELDSFYDGVPGWSGDVMRTTPLIDPGKSFEVRFAPPRAGTFIYHTHMKDLSQLTSGLYGPLIVLPPGEKFDSDIDKIFILTRYGKRKDGGMLLNGTNHPAELQWRTGQDYRLRLINIGANNTFKLALNQDGNPVTWTSHAKDGADLPPAQVVSSLASLSLSPGETYDFSFRPEHAGKLELRVDNPAFKETITQAIVVSAHSALSH